MKNSKILIVEDEQIIAENLKFILNENGYKSVEIAIDVEETLHKVAKKNYSLILMDINLGESSDMDGIDLINQLHKENNFTFIYITANADVKTVRKAKAIQPSPSGYIVKPFVNETVFANVEMALKTLDSEKYLIYSNKGIKEKIRLSEITHIEADGSYSNIFTFNNENYLVRKYLSEISREYPEFFTRIHKSILINKNYIDGYTSQYVKLNNHKLPLGRKYKAIL